MFKSRHITALLIGCLLLYAIFSVSQSRGYFFSDTRPVAMTLTHTVLFQFKADADPKEVRAACARFLSLKTNCIHPTTQNAYITSLKGGKDNSPEGLQNGITHGFVVEFSSVEDRDYYVKTDPAHKEFVKSIGSLVEKAIVVDFSNGVY